ncbi:6,7-dimethyl-8-ribityllumazine synthase [Dactylosporangium aurantiacum]|uniref:6,7-dimethyl-8-ribityllumazine synthase n=1 Tax=Dactylosporangium aurantiacum TaxID=35754 RepID=A0A9Q9IB96_9ACTN|nr:6,7-dimethyl-8-ribityllumazine synthase [Dactylosporangium aurantiacum]MDG6102910.1 6,7-dimethyl-8-ribityllumazine synthase [Dactylosporangium aurantiacum]UWZ52862.1 6,7-dimethyl-8-ribityllumazine synthase [Dactylosporangium aurantiacum]
MAGSGAPVLQRVDGTGLTLGIVATRWHAELVDHMLDRAIEAGEASNVDHITVARVDGAVELPVLAQALAHRFDAVVALGVVVRGDTAHFDYVCQSVTDGLTRVALDESTPVAHGVLTVDNLDQARARAGLPGSPEDKGYSATLAALDAAHALRLVAKS